MHAVIQPANTVGDGILTMNVGVSLPAVMTLFMWYSIIDSKQPKMWELEL